MANTLARSNNLPGPDPFEELVIFRKNMIFLLFANYNYLNTRFIQRHIFIFFYLLCYQRLRATNPRLAGFIHSYYDHYYVFREGF